MFSYTYFISSQNKSTTINEMFSSVLQEFEKNIYWGDVSQTSKHVDNIVNMLRDYVKVGKVEKKKFGEVMTPIHLVEEMLDTLPKNVWSNPDLKWLDPCNGVGIFPSIAVQRLMEGLKDWQPNEDKRYKHIMEEMIYVCELQEKNMLLYTHTFNPQDKYVLNIYNGSFLDDDFGFNNNFDIVMMNPPYQMMDGGHAAAATPLYNEFIEKAMSISDLVLSVHPSRWMAGGRGLVKFRKRMMDSNKIRLIKHFDDSQAVFGKNVDIRGGVQYFLIDNNYSGDCLYNNKLTKLNKYDIILTSYDAENIIDKVTIYDSLSEICRSTSTYPIRTNDARLENGKIDDDYIVCYVSKQKGFIKYVDRKHIKRNVETIDEYKVITARAAGKGGDGFGNTFVGNRGEICTDSYVSFKVNSKEEADNLVTYMRTKFCNFMLSLRKISQDIKSDTCKWIPLVDLSKSWTDKELYSHFNLSDDEISLIEKTIK